MNFTTITIVAASSFTTMTVRLPPSDPQLHVQRMHERKPSIFIYLFGGGDVRIFKTHVLLHDGPPGREKYPTYVEPPPPFPFCKINVRKYAIGLGNGGYTSGQIHAVL